MPYQVSKNPNNNPTISGLLTFLKRQMFRPSRHGCTSMSALWTVGGHRSGIFSSQHVPNLSWVCWPGSAVYLGRPHLSTEADHTLNPALNSAPRNVFSLLKTETWKLKTRKPHCNSETNKTNQKTRNKLIKILLQTKMKKMGKKN